MVVEWYGSDARADERHASTWVYEPEADTNERLTHARRLAAFRGGAAVLGILSLSCPSFSASILCRKRKEAWEGDRMRWLLFGGP